MLDNLKKIAVPLSMGLALMGCPESKPESKEVSGQQTDTRKALKCVVLCESGNEVEGHSIMLQCHPGIPETDIKQAEANAKAVWQKMPKEDKPECPPPMRAFIDI